MNLALVAVPMLGVLAGPAYGVDDKAIAACAAVAGQLERLACFDGLAQQAGLDGPQAQPAPVAGVGKWQVAETVNPIDDTRRVVMSLEAESGRSRWGDVVTFVARCQSNATEAYILWGDYLGDDSNSLRGDWKNVTIRVGNAPAQAQQWSTSTDGKGTFAPEWAGTLLKAMAGADQFVAQTTPYSEAPVTAVFDTRGMAEAMGPLMKTCGWALN